MAWKDGETISPLGLNRIEEAVASMNESYTPTVWQVGDVITAERLNKIEEGIAGGVTVEALSVTENGTYSEEGKAYSPVTVNVEAAASDFSTATVTVTSEIHESVSVNIPFIEEADAQQEAPAYCAAYYGIDSLGTATFVVPLYKGLAVAFIPDAATLAVTGSAQVMGERVFITGNCSITMSE